MAILPRKPQAGDRTLQSIYNAVCSIIDFLPSLEVRGDNKTIKASSFGSGKTLEVIGRSASSAQSGGSGETSDVVPAMINGGDNKTGYSVSLYANGKDQPSTESGKLFFLELALDSVIPPGTWVLAHSAQVIKTGGSEK